ncbi:hypothetical protein FB451DRAFT_735424 [Mycena latifolia]|nr:hypothetical protein FB451DRAFT_735424 [Mycena latifolia]
MHDQVDLYSDLPELWASGEIPSYLDRFSSYIPEDWHDSWDALRGILQGLEDNGMRPYEAVWSLLRLEIKREETRSLDLSSVAQFADRLGTNYLPTVSERQVLQEFCTVGSEKISSVSADIQTYFLQERTSQDRLGALRHLVDPYRALISPMRALPPEILQEIFIACLPTSHNAIMHTAQAPLLLGRVCSVWRTVSLSTAALWASVHVVLPYTSDQPPNQPPSDDPPTNPALSQRCGGLQIWLERSGDCPLSISLWDESPIPGMPSAFLDMIFPHRRRWKSLKLPHEVLYGLCDLRSEEIPLLEVLDIVDMSWHFSAPGYVRFFSIPSNLRSISFFCNNGHTLPTCSWGHITQLTLKSHLSFFTPDLPQTLELLAQCVNLQDCSLSFPTQREPGFVVSSAPAAQRVTLSQLRTLSLGGAAAVDATFNWARMLDLLVLPALDQLTIENLPSSNEHFFDGSAEISDIMLSLQHLVMRSSCALHSLFLRHASGDVDGLLRCLRRLTGLKKLSIDHAEFHDAGAPPLMPVLTELTASSSSNPPLCPNLTHLRLISCDAPDECHPVLKRLIESRCQPRSEHIGLTPLQKLDLILQKPPAWDTIKIAQAMYPCNVNITAPPKFIHPEMRWTSRWGGILPEESQW